MSVEIEITDNSESNGEIMLLIISNKIAIKPMGELSTTNIPISTQKVRTPVK
jgi:hypothetical protein